MDTSRDGELKIIFIPIYHTHGRRPIPKSSTSHIIAAESSRALVKKWTAGDQPMMLTQQVWSGAQEPAFFIRSQVKVMAVLLVRG